jgi:hypothetical protein
MGPSRLRGFIPYTICLFVGGIETHVFFDPTFNVPPPSSTNLYPDSFGM